MAFPPFWICHGDVMSWLASSSKCSAGKENFRKKNAKYLLSRKIFPCTEQVYIAAAADVEWLALQIGGQGSFHDGVSFALAILLSVAPEMER